MIKTNARLVVVLLTIAFAARGLLLILSLPIGDPLDELFHAGYAEYIARAGKIPTATSYSMPYEGLRLTANLPRTTAFGGPKLTFREYMAIPREDQLALRKMTFAPVPEEQHAFFGANYESQQPPLMYLLGAAVLQVVGGLINVRFFFLRLTAVLLACCSVPLAYAFFRRLFSQPVALGVLLAFVAFPGPGTFTSRFTNDALALPLAAAALVLLADVAQGRLTMRKSIALTSVVALGCWTKIYFLVFLPAIPAAALFSRREERVKVIRRAMLAAVAAFALFVPWMIRQYRDTGDWLGLTETKAAARAGIGLLPRIESIPHLLNGQFFANFWNTYAYPGTWSVIGAPSAVTRPALIGLASIVLLPLFVGGSFSRERARTWAGAATVLFFFVVAQLAHLTTFAAVKMYAGSEGWYSLILLPVILSAAAAYGKRIPVAVSMIAAVLFLVTEYDGTFRQLRSIYSGGAEIGVFEVFSRVGVLDTPAAVLIAVTAVWVLALVAAGVLIAISSRGATAEAAA